MKLKLKQKHLLEKGHIIEDLDKKANKTKMI